MAESRFGAQFRLDLSRLNVLVVEDSDFDRELMAQTLKAIGIENVFVAENGNVASAKIQTAYDIKKNFDVIFLDAKLPSKDGLSLLRWIRRDLKLADQIVIMITSTSVDTSVLEAKQLGVNAYMVKPVTVSVVEDKLAEVLGKAKKRVS